MVPMLGGRFQLTDLLASGDIGMVWKALDRGTGRTVAVKVLHPHLAADPRLADRFLRARRELTALWHPGIARLLDVVVDAEALALVSDLVPGTDLGRWPARYGPISAGMAREMAESIADALAGAHRAGMVHGDIKPSNVVVPPPGGESARLTDFSVAVLVRAGRRAPEPNAAHWYRAPEVTEGVVPAPSSDVYALGAVLAEVLTGGPWLEERDSGLLHRLRDLGIACMRPEPNLRPTAVQVYQGLREMVSRPPGTLAITQGSPGVRGDLPLAPWERVRTGSALPGGAVPGGAVPGGAVPGGAGLDRTGPGRAGPGLNGHPVRNWANFGVPDEAHRASNGGTALPGGAAPSSAVVGRDRLRARAAIERAGRRAADELALLDHGSSGRPGYGPSGQRPFLRRPAGMATVAGAVLVLVAMIPVIQAVRHSTGGSATSPGAAAPADRVSSAPARTAPSSAGPAAAPRLPSSATARSLQGGAEFVRYWYTVFGNAEATGDLTELARVTSPDCANCTGAIAAIRSGYASGGSMRGGTYLVRKVTNSSLWTLDRPVFDATIDRSPRATVDRSGAERDRLAPLTFANCVAILEWSGNGWRLLDVPTTGCIA